MMGGDQTPAEIARIADMDSEFFADEQPVHRVAITRPFYAGKYEVTIGQVLRWLNAPGVRFDEKWIDLDSDWCPIRRSGNRFVLNTSAKNSLGESEQQPMVTISWYGAKAFCDWCSQQDPHFRYRLPTEAEWEYMARAGSTTAFPWGDSLNGREANVNGNIPYGTQTKGPYLNRTTKVGSYRPNVWGLYDTVGNVWEWCENSYDSKAYAGRGDVTRGPVVEKGSGWSCVLRGGSWISFAIRARSAFRYYLTPDNRNDNVGFRVVAE